MKVSKEKFLTIASSLYCGCLLIANITAGKTFGVFGFALPCAVIVFPIVYILNDMLTELYGFKTAKYVIATGFFVNLIAVTAYAITIGLPASPFFTNQEAFEIVLGNTPRILCASLISYLVGSTLNAFVMQLMKNDNKGGLMARCIFSTVVGEGVDALMFITIAFAGVMPIPALVQMILMQAGFKIAYETICYPLTKRCIKWGYTLN